MKFQTATCLAMGLIENDDEWRRTISEGAAYMMPSVLRRLFVGILIHCHPSNPSILWNEFKDKLSEDYSRFLGNDISQNKHLSVFCLQFKI